MRLVFFIPPLQWIPTTPSVSGVSDRRSLLQNILTIHWLSSCIQIWVTPTLLMLKALEELLFSVRRIPYYQFCNPSKSSSYMDGLTPLLPPPSVSLVAFMRICVACLVSNSSSCSICFSLVKVPVYPVTEDNSLSSPMLPS